MVMVIETVQSADAISVPGYRRCKRPQVTKLFADQEACYATGRENPLFRYATTTVAASPLKILKSDDAHYTGMESSVLG